MAVEKYKDPVTGEWVATRAPVSKGAPKFHASQHAVDGTDPLTPEMIGAMSMDLLWENASPTSVFTAQTITVPNLSKYAFFMLYVLSNDGSEANCHIFPTEMTDVSRYGFIYFSSGLKGQSRKIKATSDTVEISNAETSTTVQNIEIIPIRIYGIKGVS